MPALITLRGVRRPWRPSLLPHATTRVEHGALQISVLAFLRGLKPDQQQLHFVQFMLLVSGRTEIRLVSLVQRQAFFPCQPASPGGLDYTSTSRLLSGWFACHG